MDGQLDQRECHTLLKIVNRAACEIAGPDTMMWNCMRDAGMDAVIKILKKYSKDKGKVSTYANKMVRWEMLEAMRVYNRKNVEEGTIVWDDEDITSSNYATEDESVETRELRNLLRSIDKEVKYPIMSPLLEGYSYVDIAKRNGVTPPSVFKVKVNAFNIFRSLYARHYNV